MTMKFNFDKIKERLEGQTKKTGTGKNSADFVKIKTAGKYLFRAIPYPHSSDPLSEPFCERAYHYSIGDEFTVGCPTNNGEKCHICDYVWERIKQLGDNKEAKMPWFKKLPTMRVWIVGKLRGAEDEDTPKFLSIGTRAKEPSANHKLIISWFGDQDTCNWLDPDQGLDMELFYEEMGAAQKKLFKTDTSLKSLGLARKESKFGADYKEFVAKVKNIDDIYPIRSTDETLAILKKWQQSQASATPAQLEGMDEDADEGLSVASSNTSPNKELETVVDDLQNKLKGLGL